MKKYFLLLGTLLATTSHGHADMLVELNQRVSHLEDQNRELRGKVEEFDHQLKQISQRFETTVSDLEMRISGGEGPSSMAHTAPHHSNVGRTPATIMKDPSAARGPHALTPTKSRYAALASGGAKHGLDAQQQYAQASQFLEQGQYKQASNKFAEFIHNNPQHQKVADASYWMGVGRLMQGQYESAASTFAAVYKDYPGSSKAPDSLLKMASCLSALGRKKDACTTLTQLSSEFPGKRQAQHDEQWGQLGC